MWAVWPRCPDVEIARAIVVTGGGPRDAGWPALAGGPRHLVPVANKPILFHNLEELRTAGVLEAVIVVEPDAELAIRRAVGDGADWRLAVRYMRAPATDALGGLLQLTRDFVRDEPVLIEHADMLLDERVRTHVVDFAGERLDALALRLARRHGNVPAGYLLSRRAVEVLRDGAGTAADPLLPVRRDGGQVRVRDVTGCRPCHGGHEALLEGNRRMLERLTGHVDPSSLHDSRVQGAVVIHPTARLQRTLVRGPAIIGAGARLSDAYVGPYTSIGDGVQIEGAEIEHSIVLAGAELRFVGTRIESSLIGRGARVVRSFEPPAALRLAIGDGADISVA
jgi:glucose-1-phosphate thymidylyltransferase